MSTGERKSDHGGIEALWDDLNGIDCTFVSAIRTLCEENSRGISIDELANRYGTAYQSLLIGRLCLTI